MQQQDGNIIRAERSLAGLSVGDSFGERFFTAPEIIEGMIFRRELPAAPWRFTDDTMMALSIVAVLREFGCINQEALARSFAKHYSPYRGYGPAMHGLLGLIRAGLPWQSAARSLFNGQGSFGNGAAMRVAPVGAFFADNLNETVEQAAKSAEVTHAHAGGIAGAIAVAVAAAFAHRAAEETIKPRGGEFLELVLPHIPASDVKQGVERALELRNETTARDAAWLLGSGSRVSAQDTVPFTLWCASRHLDNYEEALWTTVSGLGDRDTTCAIVGGIVSMSVGGVPEVWSNSREALPSWFTEERTLI